MTSSVYIVFGDYGKFFCLIRLLYKLSNTIIIIFYGIAPNVLNYFLFIFIFNLEIDPSAKRNQLIGIFE